jgi:ectoine hydroxylase-related dioxygenase (phytanoyl-CoA dioxygenase family)
MLHKITIIKRLLSLIMLLFAISHTVVARGQDVEKMSLSHKQIAYYFEHGFLIIPHFFTKHEVQEVAICADRLINDDVVKLLHEHKTGKVMYKGTQFVIDELNGKMQVHRIVWAGAAEPKLLTLARQSKLLIPVGQLLDSKTGDHLIDQLHYKLPHDEVKFDWHQDVKNRRTFDSNWRDLNHKGSFVQTIIAIDPMTVENGTILYIPDSHKRGDLFLDKITDPVELKKVAHLDKAVPFILNPGDIIFMHPYLIHGSYPNKSNVSRRIFINGFAYPGANTQPYPGEGSSKTIDLK